ncbi:MAG: excinuclease ABC subunit C [Calditrichaceae bacterium]|nr:excinuclease ABC subunit C [Calditrichaceae bacterium]RQV96701.1 MAG: excinuclease ABC subunit C [Calditrichota bacterium]
MNLEEKLKTLPDRPGCYLFKDKQGVILYVGKAGVLKNRVRSYFHKSRPEHPKLAALVKRITDLEWIITDSEIEALILENNLIKRHHPRYNVIYRDDKSYPYIRITNENLPQVFITRKIIRDGSEYFGPYTDVKNVRHTLKTLKGIFTIRSCKYDLTNEVLKSRKIKLCLEYQIKKCKGPCQGLQSVEEYRSMIEQVKRFLKGYTNDLVKELRTEMAELSDRMEFEEAARTRDKLEMLETYRNSQKMVQNDPVDRDIAAIVKENDDACAVLFRIREGKVIGKIHKYIGQVEWLEEPSICGSFLKNYYFEAEDLPGEIFIAYALEDKEAIETWLTERSKRRVRIIIPKIGEKRKLLEMVSRNARFLLDELKLQKLKSKDYVSHVVKALQRDLSLEKAPKRMECFDISNFQGSDPVASMVMFENGKPKKSEYRRFKIQTKDTPDDFAMMREVIRRRYSRILREKKNMPDLIVVDGGKGQLSSALAVLNELDIRDQQIIGLAKRLEEVFIPGYADAQMLPKTSSSLKLLQQIRDEAHRFAVTFHRQRRKKRTIASELDQIEGIGEKRRQQLLKVFGSVKKIKEAGMDELHTKGQIPKNIALKIYKHFNEE